MEKKISRQQFLVLIGCCLYILGFIGVLTNSLSVILAEVRQVYNFDMTRVSWFNTMKNLFDIAVAMILSRLFFKWSPEKAMFLCICSLMCGYILLTLAAETFLWFVIPLFLACTASMGSLAVPFILNTTFPEKGATFGGIAMACSGLGGVIFNPIAALLFEKLAWKNAIYVLCFIAFSIAVLGLLLIFHQKDFSFTFDADKAIELKEENESGKEKNFWRNFAVCTACLLGGCMCRQLVEFITLYTDSIGLGIKIGAYLSAFLSAGNILGKLVFGVLCDKVGAWKSTGLINLLIGLASVGLIIFEKSMTGLCISAFIFGTTNVVTAIAIPRCAIAAYGLKNGKKHAGMHNSISSASRSLMSFIAGNLFSATGSFKIVFFTGAALCFISFAICMIASAKRMQAKLV